jgi:hypothetical protein
LATTWDQLIINGNAAWVVDADPDGRSGVVIGI